MLGAAFQRMPQPLRRLLPVVFQHLVAGCRYLRAILLQAGEDHEIALVD